MADSKRVNGNIRQMPQQALSPLRRQERRQTPVDTVSATIISALFWPQLPVRRFIFVATSCNQMNVHLFWPQVLCLQRYSVC